MSGPLCLTHPGMRPSSARTSSGLWAEPVSTWPGRSCSGWPPGAVWGWGSGHAAGLGQAVPARLSLVALGLGP